MPCVEYMSMSSDKGHISFCFCQCPHTSSEVSNTNFWRKTVLLDTSGKRSVNARCSIVAAQGAGQTGPSTVGENREWSTVGRGIKSQSPSSSQTRFKHHHCIQTHHCTEHCPFPTELEDPADPRKVETFPSLSLRTNEHSRISGSVQLHLVPFSAGVCYSSRYALSSLLTLATARMGLENEFQG